MFPGSSFIKSGAVVAFTALLAAACSGGSATSAAPSSTTSTTTTAVPTSTTALPSTTTTTATTTTTTAAPVVVVDAADFGPYEVGRTTISLVDDTREGRTLPVDVWYPVDQGISAEASVYSFAPTIEYASEHALDGPPMSADGPFPLIVYSHGNNGLRWVSAFLTERLASHGFIVVAPDHVGNTLIDAFFGNADPADVVESNRLADIDFVLSSVLDGSGSQFLADMSESVDVDNIGMVGHSLGGWTEFNVAGDTPESPADPRVKAIVGLAAFTESIPDETLRSIHVPTLLVGGTLDVTVDISANIDRPFAEIPGRPLYRVDIKGAGHQSFSDVCLYQRLLPTIQGMPQIVIDAIDSYAVEGCTDIHLDWVEAQRITDTYTIGFFIDQLTDRVDASPIFEPGFAESFPAATFAAAGS